MARAYGVPDAEVEAALLGPPPPELYIVGRVLHLARVPGAAGGGAAPAVAVTAVAAAAPPLRDIQASAWMVADHATAAMGRALEAVFLDLRRHPPGGAPRGRAP